MPRVTIDLKEAQSRKPIPEGPYTVKVVEFTGPHKGPKAKYLTAVHEITEGEYAGRRFFDNFPLDGKGAGIFTDYLSKLTGNEYNVDDLEELDLDTDDLIGMEIGVAVADEEYEGDVQSKIKKFLKAR